MFKIRDLVTNGSAVARGPRAEYVTVTPDMARELLANSPENFRRLRKIKVDEYARDIANDNWHVNGESVKLSLDNIVTDGQHRLHAVIKANKPITTLIIWTPETLGVDKGMPRSFTQLLASLGVQNSNVTQAIIRQIYLLDRLGEIPLHHTRFTDDELLEFHDSLDAGALHSAIKYGMQIKRLRIANASSWGAAMYRFLLIDSEAATEFNRAIETGENLTANSPLLTLRNRLLVMAMSGGIRGARHYRVSMAFIIKGWNAFMENRELRVMKFLDTEEFPKIVTERVW